MTEILLKDIDIRLQKQVDKARKSIDQGNAGFAVDICRNILKQNPGCLEVRKVLRMAQYKASGSKPGGLTKIFQKATQMPFNPAKLVEKDALAAIETAEDMLAKNPYNSLAHKLLGLAALEHGIADTAAFAYEEIRRHEPDNIANLIDLGKALLAARRPKEAEKVAEGILKRDPGNGAASELLKHASVAVSEDRGWAGAAEGEEKTYQDMVKDSDESVELEQASRHHKDEEALRTLIGSAKLKLEETPDDINLYRDISEHYEKLKDYDSAIEWIGKARAQPKGQTDSTLERTEGELHAERMRAGIVAKEEALEADPENATLKAEVEAARKELDDYVFQMKKTFVEKYPNDYLAHFEFGELQFKAGQLDESIKSFQLAQRNRQVRMKALLYLGKAFKATRKFDLAAERLEETKKDHAMMDHFKKEVVYELADCYEKMGRTDDAIREYKIIYSADIAYRDVADKIDKFYEN